MKEEKINIKKIEISGVNNPLLCISGYFNKYDSKLEFIIDNNRVEPIEEEINEMLFFEYKLKFVANSKNIEIY